MTKPNSGGGGGGGSSRPSRSGGKPLVGGGGGKKPLRAVRALKQPDNSVLRPPLETSVAGLRQAVRLFETSTPEVVHLMSFECDIIYECRVCKNLFRSVANFISHKRIYCTRRFNHVQNSQVVEDHTLLVDGCDQQQQLMPPTRITARQDLTTIVQQASMAQYYRDAEDKATQRDQTRYDATVHLQPIDNTSYGVYQTYDTPGAGKLMKDQVSELQNIMLMKEGVTLGPDGKILPNGSRIALDADDPLVTPEKTTKVKQHCPPPSASEEHILSHHEHICGLCKIKFSSKKTLSHHTRNVHGSFRVAYSCPCCTNLYTNSWSVMRHLAKVHRKTNDQVRRLRPQIQKKQVHAEKLLKKPGDASNNTSPTSSTSSTNTKRLADTSDNSSSEVLRCSGCRRQFERQAAFQSHSQICHKRRMAALRNSQDNQSKMAEPKPSNSSEKRIGIQLRVNYCKSATPSPSPAAASTSPKSRRSERHNKGDSAATTTTCLDRASLQLTPLSNSKERQLNGTVNLPAPAPVATSTRPLKIDTKSKTKKIESISRLLMEAIGGASPPSTPIINGVKHCDNSDDSNVVPNDACSRSSSRSSTVTGDNPSTNRLADAESRSNGGGRLSRSRTSRLPSVDVVTKVEDDAAAMKELVVEVNGVGDHGEGEGDYEGGQLSPSKEGVIRVLTRYQLKSICKKDEVKDEVPEVESEVKIEVEPIEPEVDRLREMFRTNILYKSLQCLVCLQKMKNIIELKNHVAEHFGCNHFRCTFAQCAFVTYARGECVRHVMRAHLKQNERHLAAGFVGDINKQPTDNREQENNVPNSNDALQKSDAMLRRNKRSLPTVKKDTPKNNGVKQESADGAKNSAAAKKRKLEGVAASSDVAATCTVVAPPSDSTVQLPSTEKVEMTLPNADSDSEEDVATQSEREGFVEEVGGGESSAQWPPRTFRGFNDAASTAASRRTRSLDQCNIRTMVMNVIFGPNHPASNGQ